eukprot:s6949_g1.t1
MEDSISDLNTTVIDSSEGAAAAEKEQKKQEHEVAEIQETLGNLKNKAQGASPDRWSDRWSALLLFPWQKWKESSEKTCSFLIVSVEQKLNGLQKSISKFNATLLNSSTGAAAAEKEQKKQEH